MKTMRIGQFTVTVTPLHQYQPGVKAHGRGRNDFEFCGNDFLGYRLIGYWEGGSLQRWSDGRCFRTYELLCAYYS